MPGVGGLLQPSEQRGEAANKPPYMYKDTWMRSTEFVGAVRIVEGATMPGVEMGRGNVRENSRADGRQHRAKRQHADRLTQRTFSA